MKRYYFGWIPDIPDHRDYSKDSLKTILKIGNNISVQIPRKVDLRKYFTPVEDQENLGSCTAHAVIGLLEYFEKRFKNEYIDASRLFLYKVTRKLYGFVGDTGAYIRGTIKALRLFGVPPEKYYPYIVSKFDDEPPAFCYAFAQNYKALAYYRLDISNNFHETIDNVLKSLAKEIPCAFGFSVYNSIYNTDVIKTGIIPIPSPNDALIGGHAVVAVGYDLDKDYLIIRNSWGEKWGDQGYGYLPLDYIRKGLAKDFWCLVDISYESLADIL